MSEYTDNIVQIARAIESAEQDLIQAKGGLGKVRCLNGQDGYSVSVNGVSIPVAVNGGREAGWSAVMIRGREMIHLGAMKAMQAMVTEKEGRLAELKATLLSTVNQSRGK